MQYVKCYEEPPRVRVLPLILTTEKNNYGSEAGVSREGKGRGGEVREEDRGWTQYETFMRNHQA